MNKRCKGLLSTVIALLMALSLWIPTFGAEAAEKAAKLTIIHVNDVHSRVDGEAYVSALKREREAAGEAVLLLNAGDTLHGQPFATLTQGDSIVEVMNEVGYDVMVPGNHDFNYGLDRLKELSGKMDYDLVAANVFDKASGEPVFDAYVVKEILGFKVGIFGLVTPETATKTNPKNVEGVTFQAPETAAARAVDVLKAEGVDVIIALTHLGIDNDTDVTNRSSYLPSEVEGIDVIIDGHSHTAMEEGMLVNGTLIAQTGEYLNNIGVVELNISDGEVVEKTASLVPVSDEEGNPLLEADERIVRIIEIIDDGNKAITSQVIGSTLYDLQGEREYVRKMETNLANLVTDAMLRETGADIAITNGGGLRASILAGDITKGDVLAVLPFGNYIVTMDIKGADVMAALETGVSSYPELAGSYAQVSGVRFTFDPDKKAGERIGEAVMEKTGEPLDPAKTYRIATNDFMAAGGDGYSMLTAKDNYNEYAALDEAVIQYLQSGGEIVETAKGRVKASALANDVEPDVPGVPVPVAELPSPVVESPLSSTEQSSPVAKSPEAEVQTYTVQQGDVLWRIAKSFETSWQKLAEINMLNNPHLIFPGQIITIQ